MIVAVNTLAKFYEVLGRMHKPGRDVRWCSIGNCYMITDTPTLNRELKRRNITPRCIG